MLESMGIKNYKVVSPNVIQIYERLEESGQINVELTKKDCVIDTIRVAHEKLENYCLELTK